MIIHNEQMFDGRLYKKRGHSNETKLKELMKNLLLKEEPSETIKPKTVGGGLRPQLWRGQFKKQEKTKTKTFSL